MPGSGRSLIGIATLAAVPVICGIIATLLFLISGTSQALVTHTLLVKEKLGILLSATQDIETGHRRFLITGDATSLPAYERGLATVFDSHRDVLNLVSDNPEQTKRVAAWKPLIDERIALVDESFKAFKLAPPTDETKLAMLERGALVTDKLRIEIAATSAEEGRLFELRNADYEQRRFWLITVLCLTIFSTLAIAYVIWQREQERSRDVEAASLILEDARVALALKVERTADLAKERDRAETLLRDVTHRIGNTLTLVVGFLNLHIRHSSDPKTIQTLSGARERVMAISSAQRRMNVANDLELVRIDQLIKGVLDDLAEAQPNDRVSFAVDIPPLHAPAREATSLCVLIQEFVVNALKHAFPGGRSGVIKVKLRPLAEKGAVLEVSDNGIGGVPAAAATPGLGTQIAERLALQFGGKVSYKSAGGLSVEVDLPDLSLKLPDGRNHADADHGLLIAATST